MIRIYEIEDDIKDILWVFLENEKGLKDDHF